MNPAPGTTGWAALSRYPSPLQVSAGLVQASPGDSLKTSKRGGEVRRRTVDCTRPLGAGLGYLGNSQSAIRTGTNGKRG